MFFNNKFGGFQMNDCCCENKCPTEFPCNPVIEPTIEKCVTRDICHTVEQV